MTRFEYLAIFYGIIVGLALGNIASSVHTLLEARERVRWHWMAPVNAAGVTIATLGTFWAWWVGRDAGISQPIFLNFLPGSVASLVLYVVCAATLPDTVPESGIDLKEFYFSSHRQFWGLLAAYFLLRLFQGVLNIVSSGFDPQSVHFTLPFVTGLLVLLPIATSLIFVRAQWWHGLCICLLLVISLIMFGPMKL